MCAFPSGQNLAFLRNKSNYSVDSNKLTESVIISLLYTKYMQMYSTAYCPCCRQEKVVTISRLIITVGMEKKQGPEFDD